MKFAIIMIVICLIVVGSEIMVLLWFLKRLKKITVSFWGEAAAKARSDLDNARSRAHKEAEAAKITEKE
jgi:hypothetical protein